jgi:hypothetical protein
MIELKLGSWVSRTLALTLPLLILGSIWFGIVQPLQSWKRGLEASLADTSQTIARLKSALEQGATKAGRPDSNALNVDFLQGSDDALMMADVQTRLRAIVVGQNAELNSARALPMKQIDEQDYVGLRLQIHGTLKGIHAIIYAIEDQTPLLFVERAQLRMEERRGAVEETAEQLSSMVAELDVYGAKWPGLQAPTGVPAR